MLSMQRLHVAVLAVAYMAMPALAVDPAPAGYTLIKTTAAGRVLGVVKNQKQAKVADAIEVVLNDLDDFFDDDYNVFGARENAADTKAGFATLSAKYDGKPVRGLVSTRLTDNGSVNVVVICQADAPMKDWQELLGSVAPAAQPAAAAAQPAARASGNPLDGAPSANPLDTAAGGGAGANPLDTNSGRTANANPLDPVVNSVRPQASPPPVLDVPTPRPPAPATAQLTEYRFPDNTGSIGLPEGWQPAGGGSFKGPGGQSVLLGFSLAANVPGSMAHRMAMQYPVAGYVSVIAPFTGPAEAMTNLSPFFSQISQKNGGPPLEIDSAKLVQELPPQSQGSRWGVVTYGTTTIRNGQKVHLQCMAQVGCTPLTNESWMIYLTGCSAPDATAAADMPTMLAMIASWRCNDAQIQANTQTWMANRQQWFNAQQEGHREQVAANDAQNAAWRANSNRIDRANDNWSEAFRGVRDIQDTRTGEMTQVNLGHVDQIINDLNTVDPDRWKQVPLRDKLDPIPGNR